jgi:hypothetical protein
LVPRKSCHTSRGVLRDQRSRWHVWPNGVPRPVQHLTGAGSVSRCLPSRYGPVPRSGAVANGSRTSATRSHMDRRTVTSAHGVGRDDSGWSHTDHQVVRPFPDVGSYEMHGMDEFTFVS